MGHTYSYMQLILLLQIPYLQACLLPETSISSGGVFQGLGGEVKTGASQATCAKVRSNRIMHCLLISGLTQ